MSMSKKSMIIMIFVIGVWTLGIINHVTTAEQNTAEFYFQRGVESADKGHHDQAIADFTQGIQINPRDAEAYRNRGFAYKEKGQLDKAIADFSRSLQMNP